MPSPDAAARHTGAGVARRQAHHERMRDERAREAAAGDAELPPEDDAVEMASAAQLLDSVAEVGPNYTLTKRRRKSIILTVWGRGGLVGEPKWCFPRRCARLRASSRCARLRRRVRAALGSVRRVRALHRYGVWRVS